MGKPHTLREYSVLREAITEDDDDDDDDVTSKDLYFPNVAKYTKCKNVAKSIVSSFYYFR